MYTMSNGHISDTESPKVPLEAAPCIGTREPSATSSQQQPCTADCFCIGQGASQIVWCFYHACAPCCADPMGITHFHWHVEPNWKSLKSKINDPAAPHLLLHLGSPPNLCLTCFGRSTHLHEKCSSGQPQLCCNWSYQCLTPAKH